MPCDEKQRRLFRNDEVGYRGWLGEHPNGFVLNADNKPRPSYLVLHLSQCVSVSDPGKEHFTDRGQVKYCSSSLAVLEDFVRDEIGRIPHKCRFCFPR